MKLPFNIEQFLGVFEKYNHAIYPLQVLFYALAVVVVFLAFKAGANRNKIIAAILSFYWLWMGLVYQVLFFSSINKLAYAFGAFFMIQSALFFYMGVLRNRLSFSLKKNLQGFLGILLVLYALILYPWISHALGHRYPASPGLGLPCPTTIFTFGLLLWSDKKLKPGILIIPLSWSVVGLSAALNLGMTEDYGLIVAGILSSVFILFQNWKFQHPNMYSLRG